MERPKDLLIFEGISCIAYNKDYSLCVLSKKDKNLYIYKVNSFSDVTNWQLKYTLKSVSLIYKLKIAF